MIFALLLAAAAVAPDPAPPAPTPIAAPTVVVDEGAIAEAVESVLVHGKNAVRVAVPPVADPDPARQRAVEIAIVRAILDRRREEAVTPAYLRAHLKAQSEAQAHDITPELLKPFACDHILLASVVDEGGKTMLRLKLLFTETGEVLGEESADLGAGKQTSASAGNVRITTEKLVEQIAFGVESAGADIHTHRIAVMPLKAEGAAKEARLDQFTQSELTRALKRRGFLVVERAQLAAAMDQLALGQELEEASAPKLGQALGAQSLMVGSVADAGTTFLVSVRVLSADTGAVLTAASASLPRDDVVSMASVETRTPIEAALRSAVAPGWGQAFNGDGVKAIAFGVGGYGGLVTTAALGVSGIAVQAHYNDIPYFQKLPPAQASAEAVDARNTFTTLYIGTAIAGGVTATVWGLGVVDAVISAPPN